MFIYKTTNLINGKIYIGQHRKNKQDYLGSGVLLQKAIKKYGKENFVREILEDGIITVDELNSREQYWIKIYNSTDVHVGYNLAAGGKGIVDPTGRIGKKIAISKTGKKVSEEGRRNISKAHLGIRQTEESKQKISSTMSGAGSYWYNKKLSEEHRKKISVNHADLGGVKHPSFGKKFKNASSKFLGVYWDSTAKKWHSVLRAYGEVFRLGYFRYETEAAMAYNEAAIEIYGYNAKLNSISKADVALLWEME